MEEPSDVTLSDCYKWQNQGFPPCDPPDVHIDEYDIITMDEKKNVPRFHPRAVVSWLFDMRVCFDGSVPRIFDGRVYSPLSRNELTSMIYRAVDTAALNVGAQYMPSETEVRNIVKAASALLQKDSVPFRAAEKDVRYAHRLHAVRNGILDLDSEALLPFTPDVFLTHCINAEWTPDAGFASVVSVVEGIVPDPETRRFLYTMIGYILFSENLFPPALFNLYGPGNTGKSALANMICELMGRESVSELGMSQITSRFGCAGLKGKSLNVCGEAGGTSSRVTGVDGEMLKRLSDGGRVVVEEKGVQQFEMVNRAKLLFCTNKVPDFGDDSSGLYRRLYVIPCRVRQDQRARIFDRMTDPASLSWVLSEAYVHYERFRDDGGVFSPSPEMTIELDSFKAQDTVSDYLAQEFGNIGTDAVAEEIVTHPSLCYVPDIYAAYTKYTRDMGAVPLSKRKFAERIRNEFDLATKVCGIRVSDGWTTRMKYVRKEELRR